MSHIFVSYSASEKERVEPLVALLGEVAPVWWDQRIMHGDSWDEEIEEALDEAGCVVAVWTERSVDSRWVRAEARYGLKYHILVPVRLDPVDIPLEFSGVETALLEGWDGSPAHPEAATLKASVAAVIARGRKAAPHRRAEEPVAVPADPAAVEVPAPAAGPPPRTGRRRSPMLERLAGAAVLLVLLVGGILAYRNRGDGDDPVARPVGADTVRPTPADSNRVPVRPAPPVFQVAEIIVSETETATLAQALDFLEQDSLKRGYHYLVDVDGRIHSYFDETRRARHTSGRNAASLSIGLVHRARSRPYGDAQIDGLVALLTMLAHDHHVDVREIRSKGEVDPRRPKEITARMPEIRRRVSALLGEWRVEGTRPAAARPRIFTPPAR